MRARAVELLEQVGHVGGAQGERDLRPVEVLGIESRRSICGRDPARRGQRELGQAARRGGRQRPRVEAALLADDGGEQRGSTPRRAGLGDRGRSR